MEVPWNVSKQPCQSYKGGVGFHSFHDPHVENIQLCFQNVLCDSLLAHYTFVSLRDNSDQEVQHNHYHHVGLNKPNHPDKGNCHD